ncbi:MAG: hypothetical protein RLP44_27350 [Aggregatilineales bacterium]
MTENSIAQIVAEIKAKVHEIDTQLSTIEVGELPENFKPLWDSMLKSWDRVKLQIEDLNVEALNKHWQAILFDLRSPLTHVHGTLQFFPRASEAGFECELSLDINAKIHEALPHLQIIAEALREIDHFYRGDI